MVIRHAYVSSSLPLVLGLGVLSALGVGCEEKKPPLPAPAASVATPAEVPSSAKGLELVVDPASTASIDMPAPKEHIKATASGAMGTLHVDPHDLTKSRGQVKFDLTTLTTSTFGDAKKDGAQTGHARTWLEVADGEEGKLPDDTKAQNRYATYTIQAIERPSATDLAQVAPVRDGEDEVRKVTVVTKGDLLIHGHKVDREAEVEVELRYAPGSPVEKPKGLRVRTKSPLHIVLAEHDVKPRDGFGKIAKSAFSLLGTKVADTADVTLDVRAASK